MRFPGMTLIVLLEIDVDDDGDDGTDDDDLPVKVLLRLVWAGKKIITKKTRLSQVDLKLEIFEGSVVPKVANMDAISKITRHALSILEWGTIPLLMSWTINNLKTLSTCSTE